MCVCVFVCLSVCVCLCVSGSPVEIDWNDVQLTRDCLPGGKLGEEGWTDDGRRGENERVEGEGGRHMGRRGGAVDRKSVV